MSDVFDDLDIPKKIKRLDGVILGEVNMPSNTTLSKDDRSAVIDAVAANMEQKQELSSDLKDLAVKFGVTEEEIIDRMFIRLLNAVLG